MFLRILAGAAALALAVALFFVAPLPMALALTFVLAAVIVSDLFRLRRIALPGLVAAAAILALGFPAFAGVPTGGLIPAAGTVLDFSPTTTTVDVGSIWDTLVPWIAVVLAAAATAIIAWLSQLAAKVLHVNLEAKYRDSLHSAAVTGINLALAKIGTLLKTKNVDVKSALVAAAVNWVNASVPDALKYLGASEAKVGALVESKLKDMLGVAADDPLDATTIAAAVAPASPSTTAPQS